MSPNRILPSENWNTCTGSKETWRKKKEKTKTLTHPLTTTVKKKKVETRTGSCVTNPKHVYMTRDREGKLKD